MSVAEAP